MSGLSVTIRRTASGRELAVWSDGLVWRLPPSAPGEKLRPPVLTEEPAKPAEQVTP